VEKRERVRIQVQGLPYLWVPPIISGTGKGTDFKFCRNFHIVDWTKACENVGNSSRGRSQGVPKVFRAPMYRAHCAVIFAIAQVSCDTIHACDGRTDRRNWRGIYAL